MDLCFILYYPMLYASGNQTIIGSDNDLLPVLCQAII